MTTVSLWPQRVLLLSPFPGWPLLHGSIVRTHHLARFLSAERRVWLVCRPNAPPDLPQVILNHPNRFRQLLPPALLRRLTRLIRQENIELILVSHYWSLGLGLALRGLTGRPLLFDDHNAEYLRFRRQGSRLWPWIGLVEGLGCRAAAGVLCVSETDQAFLAQGLRLPPAKFQVIPNGADVAMLQEVPVDPARVRAGLGLAAEEKMVLFYGTLAHRPNHAAVEVIRQHLAPQVNARFVVAGVGGHAYAAAHPQLPANLHMLDFVEDIVALIKSADVVIAPLTGGSGTRFKIIEAAACGRPVISTSLGAEGLDREAFGDALTICDDWPGFALCIRQRLALPLTWQPSPRFEALYTWRNIFGRIDFNRLRPAP